MTAVANSFRTTFLVLLVVGCHAGKQPAVVPMANRVAVPNTPAWLVVAGKQLPVHTTTEPRDDITFVAPAASALAQRYRAMMLSFEPEPEVQGRAAFDPSIAKGLSLRLIQVHRDAAGNFYLYRACDGPNRPIREVISDGVVLRLGGTEDWRHPIVAMTREKRGFTVTLDLSDVPEPFRGDPQWSYTKTSRPGLYEGLMMTAEEAAKLDIVVQLCRRAKRWEFSFDDPHSRH